MERRGVDDPWPCRSLAPGAGSAIANDCGEISGSPPLPVRAGPTARSSALVSWRSGAAFMAPSHLLLLHGRSIGPPAVRRPYFCHPDLTLDNDSLRSHGDRLGAGCERPDPIIVVTARWQRKVGRKPRLPRNRACAKATSTLLRHTTSWPTRWSAHT